MSRNKNILVITYWPLDNALITTYTLPYLRIILSYLPSGSRIWLMTLSSKKTRNSAGFHQVQAGLRKQGIESIDFEYSRFGVKMILRTLSIFTKLITVISQHNISSLHAWCTPGGAIGYALSVITGRTLIIDSYEPHAETMIETGVWKRHQAAYKLLLWLEKKQTQKASQLICAAPGMMEYAARTYKVSREEKFVKPACVDLEIFSPKKESRINIPELNDNDVVCVYAGKFGGIYLETETFDFFSVAASYWKDRFKVLLLTSHTEEEVSSFCTRSGFNRKDLFLHFVPHHEVPRYIAMADFAICPVKPIPTKKYCSPIKDGEYWACGLPVVITEGISNDSDIISGNNAGYVLRSLDREEYKVAVAAIQKILQEEGHRRRIRKIAELERNFSLAENIYQAIYA